MTQELTTTQLPLASPLVTMEGGKSNLSQIVSQEDKVHAAETQLSDDEEESHYMPRKGRRPFVSQAIQK